MPGSAQRPPSGVCALLKQHLELLTALQADRGPLGRVSQACFAAHSPWRCGCLLLWRYIASGSHGVCTGGPAFAGSVGAAAAASTDPLPVCSPCLHMSWQASVRPETSC